MRAIRSDLQSLELTAKQRTELDQRRRAVEEREQRLRPHLRDERGQSTDFAYEQRLLPLANSKDPATGPRRREFVLRALPDEHERNLDDLEKGQKD